MREDICGLFLSSQFSGYYHGDECTTGEHGQPINNNDRLWLKGPTPNNPEHGERSLEYKLSSGRSIVANHLHVFWQRGAVIKDAGFL